MTPTGFIPLDQAVIWCAAIVAVAGGLALVWRLLRGVRRFTARIAEFLDDWTGVENRPGVPGRRGVMERLEWVEHELKPNSGQSLRDSVDRIESIINPQDGESLLHKVDRIEGMVTREASIME